MTSLFSMTSPDVAPPSHDMSVIRYYLVFSDGHNTGLFSWDILYQFATTQDTMMADYLARLETLGLSRE